MTVTNNALARVLEGADSTVRIQDDLFRAINGSWIDSHEIPTDLASDGSFTALALQAEEQVRQIIEELAAANPTEGEAGKIARLFNSWMDVDTLNAKGTAPLEADLAPVEAAANREELARAVGALSATGVHAFFSYEVASDLNDPSRYTVFVSQSGIGLPDEAAATAVREMLARLAAEIRQGLAQDSQGLELVLEPAEEVTQVIEDAQRLLDVLRVLPNGVDQMSPSMPGLVETSTNLAAVRCKDGALHISCLLRSSSEPQKLDLADRMAAVVRLAGGQSDYSADYGGWLPKPDSPLVRIFQRTGEQVFGHRPPLKAIHAGLECGILSTHYPHWEMISFGPTITGAHSPDEAVQIDTVGRCHQWLLMCLKALAEGEGKV